MALDIKHHGENVFIVTPPTGMLDTADQVKTLAAFTDELKSHAKKYKEEHDGEGAKYVIDLSQTASLNSHPLAHLSDDAKQLSFNGSKIILAKTDMLTTRLLSKMDPEKAGFDFSNQRATLVADTQVQATLDAREEANARETEKQAAAAQKAAASVPDPVAPPPPAEHSIEQHGNATVLRLKAGSYTDENHAQELGQKINDAMPAAHATASANKKVLILDLSEVKFLDDSAIGKIMYASTAARKKGVNIEIVGANDSIVQSFKIKKMDKLVTIKDDAIEDRIAAANAKPGAAQDAS